MNGCRDAAIMKLLGPVGLLLAVFICVLATAPGLFSNTPSEIVTENTGGTLLACMGGGVVVSIVVGLAVVMHTKKEVES